MKPPYLAARGGLIPPWSLGAVAGREHARQGISELVGRLADGDAEDVSDLPSCLASLAIKAGSRIRRATAISFPEVRGQEGASDHGPRGSCLAMHRPRVGSRFGAQRRQRGVSEARGEQNRIRPAAAGNRRGFIRASLTPCRKQS